MRRADLAKRVAVLVVTAVVVLAIAGAGATVEPDTEPSPIPDTTEYAPSNVVPEQIPATGTISPDASAADGTGTVLIDDAHNNRFSRSDIEPLVDALVRVGYTVEFYTGGDLAANLRDADAFLVVDPSSEFAPGDVDDVRTFTGRGGRLVMVGEPTRVAVSSGLLGTSISTQESQLTSLASEYGMSIDTRYLYNQETADGNYKHVVAESTGRGDLDGVDRTAMYTAAAVTVHRGTTLLETTANTQKSPQSDVSGRFPVAATKGNALLVGDKTFMSSGRYNVADNEAFLAYMVEFLVAGDYDPPPEPDDGATATPGDRSTTTEGRSATTGA
ncbi:DUF4350 domain-containing protein [Haloplanus sp. GCM10025708]|uniref:DUF4350 domain-containing protein n=1 Tax=Haloferacaceae TaxID=1644056 RepID=UPI003622DBA8